MTISDVAIDDLFTRPTRAALRGTPLLAPMPMGVATIPIVCVVCSSRVDHPIVWDGKLCRLCRSDIQQAQERVQAAWEAAQAKTSEGTLNRYLSIVMARMLTSTDRMQRFLDLIHAGKDERMLGDAKRTAAILRDIAAGMSDVEVIAAAQARVQRGIDTALKAQDDLSILLIAEQQYHAAMREIGLVMDSEGII